MSTKPKALTAFFGGTFDPFHLGHFNIAKNLCQQCPIQRFYFLPCGQPVHKPLPKATPAQRLTMIEQAIHDAPELDVDPHELYSITPNYTVTTLTALRATTDAPLALVMGDDVLLQLPTWHQWQRILELTHLIVIHRPHIKHPKQGIVAQLIQEQSITKSADLLNRSHGSIYFHPMIPHTVSATEIQQRIRQGLKVSHLLPPPVWDYIQSHQLYV